MFWGIFWIPVRSLLDEGGAPKAGLGDVRALSPSAFSCSHHFVTVMLARRSALLGWGSGADRACLPAAAVPGSTATPSCTRTMVERFMLSLLPRTDLVGELLSRLVLGESIPEPAPPARHRTAWTSAASVVMLGVESGWPLPRNAGDWLALERQASRECLRRTVRYAARSGGVGALEQMLGFYGSGDCSSAACSSSCRWAKRIAALPELSAIGGWTWAVLRGDRVLGCGRRHTSRSYWGVTPKLSSSIAVASSILLMMELVVGAVAASLIDMTKPFGLREMPGRRVDRSRPRSGDRHAGPAPHPWPAPRPSWLRTPGAGQAGDADRPSPPHRERRACAHQSPHVCVRRMAGIVHRPSDRSSSLFCPRCCRSLPAPQNLGRYRSGFRIRMLRITNMGERPLDDSFHLHARRLAVLDSRSPSNTGAFITGGRLDLGPSTRPSPWA